MVMDMPILPDYNENTPTALLGTTLNLCVIKAERTFYPESSIVYIHLKILR